MDSESITSKPFGYRLKSSSMENAYRVHRLFRDRRQATTILALAAAIIGLYLPLDFLQQSGTGLLLPIASARIVGIAAALVTIWRIQRINAPRTFDRWLCGGAATIVAHLMVASALTTDDPVSMAAWDIVAIFVLFTSVPIPPAYLLGISSLLTLGSFWTWTTQYAPAMDVVAAIATPFAYIAANLFGLLFATRLNRANRQEFLSLNHEIRMQDELMEALAKLRETMTTKERLFSIVGHDLRGPMGSLAALGEYMIASRDRLSEDEVFYLLESIRKGSQESYALLDNLLQWSLSETDSLPFEPEEIDLNYFFDHAIDLYALEADNKGIALRADCRVPAIVADAKMLHTIMRNLTGNAIKYTDEGGTVTLTARRIASGAVEISVIDTGIGMNETQLANLFQLKVASRSEGTRREIGTGLGLKLCHEFALRHRGTIVAVSAPGKGSRFTVTLPQPTSTTTA